MRVLGLFSSRLPPESGRLSRGSRPRCAELGPSASGHSAPGGAPSPPSTTTSSTVGAVRHRIARVAGRRPPRGADRAAVRDDEQSRPAMTRRAAGAALRRPALVELLPRLAVVTDLAVLPAREPLGEPLGDLRACEPRPRPTSISRSSASCATTGAPAGRRRSPPSRLRGQVARDDAVDRRVPASRSAPAPRPARDRRVERRIGVTLPAADRVPVGLAVTSQDERPVLTRARYPGGPARTSYTGAPVDLQLAGKVALVTGSSRGIGRAIATPPRRGGRPSRPLRARRGRPRGCRGARPSAAGAAGVVADVTDAGRRGGRSRRP